MTNNQLNYNKTIRLCFAGYIVQAIVVNFTPLLFVMFQKTYGITLSQLTSIITFSFLTQLFIDFFSAKIVDLIGQKLTYIMANGFAFLGIASLSFTFDIFSNAFVGLIVSCFFYSIGGGLLEVIVSPLVQACPSKNKNKQLSLLHSVYSWGQALVIVLSTVYFLFLGVENFRYLTLVFAVIPLVIAICFIDAPVKPLEGDEDFSNGMKSLLKNKIFWLLFVLMICSGAAEQAVAQWASTFAEMGLKVDKTLGDLLGPSFFAIMMGFSRTIYGKCGAKLKLYPYILFSSILCIASFVLMTIVPNKIINLLGCGICGFSVGIMWPGILATATNKIPRGGTLMFSWLALGGDIGCTCGPGFVGIVSNAFDGNLIMGLKFAIIFPALFILVFIIMKIKKTKN